MATIKYHTFLSHNWNDKPAVEELARRLQREGIEPWLDKWHLIPGGAWQPAIEHALSECGSCAVFIGPGGLGSWQHEEMRAAIDRRVKDHRAGEGRDGFRVIPVLLPGAQRPDRSKLPEFLTSTTWVVFGHSLDDADAFHRLVCGIRGTPPGEGPGGAIFEGQCPYRGLEAFEEDHARFFFGREALVEWLLHDLRPAPEGKGRRFLAIVGPSGSGKSSLARAGLIPALRRGALDGSADWPVVICHPHTNPLESLAVALARLHDDRPNPAALRALIRDFQDGENGLHLFARAAFHGAPPTRRLVVLVDQFEEVFTLDPDESLRRAFLKNLLYASSIAGGQTVVLLTLRADFYGKCASDPELAAALSDGQELVGPMTAEELRQAIERPAHLVGCELEPGLTDLLLQDVEGQPGALPLLQYALLELWRTRQGRRLTVESYRALGGVQGALENRADAILAAFSEPEREVCRRIFLRLTQPGEGTEDTKRRVPVAELSGDAEEARAQVVRDVLHRLADARLITTEGNPPATSPESPAPTEPDAQVEVAHEALIRGWSQLRLWIDADRAGLRTHRQLTEAARDWQRHAQDPSFLFRGSRLAVAREWAMTHADDLNPLERDFLSASERAHADALSAARRSAARLRRRAQALLAALAATLLVAVFAGLQWNEARKQRNAAQMQTEIAKKATRKAKSETARAEAQTRIATSRQLSSMSRAEQKRRYDLTLLLSVAALQIEDTVEARASLLDALMLLR